MLSPLDLLFLRRCLDLASMADARVFPNPKVGAVLAYEGRIIGEGFHRAAGGPHAEVEALRSVPPADRPLIPLATLYVSLEPCCTYGRTPPCTELIFQEGIPRVVAGCLDPNPRVAGRGMALLREAGVEALLAEDAAPFEALNRIFFTNQQQERPWITLKWAETADHFIGSRDPEGKPGPLAISGPEALDFAHALRAAHHAICIGAGTARADNPRLSTRRYPGRDPLRVVFDRNLRLPPSLHLLSDGSPTLIVNGLREESAGPLRYLIPAQGEDLHLLARELYARVGICSLLVEGGSQLLGQFLRQGAYDEVFCICSPWKAGAGVEAPRLPAEWAWDQISPLGKDLLLCARSA
jgi:diaminohydroxyphosphoribosylaminopyrimidine deaminase/5-amino-6-(5-phosphoribosylamino)uracil reductase